jgi:hypothetical protein
MPQSVGQLLVKGLRRLPEEEQDEAVSVLLDRFFGYAMHRGVRDPFPAKAPSFSQLFGKVLSGERDPAAGEAEHWKMLPIRLPRDDYERLRAWCQAHEFSMAVVIRTLVERFLDSQEQAEGRPGG